MSRRYGRNQKRAARAREAALHQALVDAFADRDGLRRRLERSDLALSKLREVIADWDSDIRSVLGPYTSFAINDRTYRVDDLDHIREMPIYPPLNISAMLADEQVPDVLEHHVVQIYSLIASELSDMDRSRLQRYLSLRVQVGRDRPVAEACLAVSENNWRHLQHSEAGRDRVARKIAPDLMRVVASPPQERKKNAG